MPVNCTYLYAGRLPYANYLIQGLWFLVPNAFVIIDPDASCVQ